MNELNNTFEPGLDEHATRERFIVNLLVEKVYPQLLKGVETYQHFRWRLQQLNEVHLGVIDRADTSGWLAQILEDVREIGANKENPYHQDEILKLLLTHLKTLNVDEVSAKLNAINTGE